MTTAALENAREKTSAPRSAYRFAASSVKLTEKDSQAPAQEGVLSVPYELVVRSNEVIDHWYWGPIVHDFAGMTHRDRIPLDMDHCYGDPVGFANGFAITDEGLILTGELVALAANDDDAAR